jgi:hypothetical protein
MTNNDRYAAGYTLILSTDTNRHGRLQIVAIERLRPSRRPSRYAVVPLWLESTALQRRKAHLATILRSPFTASGMDFECEYFANAVNTSKYLGPNMQGIQNPI